MVAVSIEKGTETSNAMLRLPKVRFNFEEVYMAKFNIISSRQQYMHKALGFRDLYLKNILGKNWAFCSKLVIGEKSGF